MILKSKLREINYNEATLIFLFFYLGVTLFSVAISNICLGIACALFLTGLILKQIELKDFKLKLYLVIITPFILTLISTLNSNSYDAGIKYLNLRLPILVTPFILLSLKTNKKTLNKGFTILILAVVLAAFTTFYNAIRYYNQGFLFQADFTYFITVIHHPYFGVYTLIALLAFLKFHMNKNWWINTFVVVILTFAIALTTSRMVYVTFFICTSIFLFQKLTLKKFKFSIILIGIVTSLFILSNKSIINKFSRSFNYSESPRMKLWNNAFRAVDSSNKSIFGIGIGDYYKEKKDVYFGHNYTNQKKGVYGYNPHSQLVEFYVTNGLLGVLIILFALLYYVFTLKNQNTFAFSVFMVLFLFSLVECIFNRQYGVQLYSVVIPLIVSSNFKRK